MRRAIATAFGFMLLAGCTAATPGAEGPRSTETGREIWSSSDPTPWASAARSRAT